MYKKKILVNFSLTAEKLQSPLAIKTPQLAVCLNSPNIGTPCTAMEEASLREGKDLSGLLS